MMVPRWPYPTRSDSFRSKLSSLTTKQPQPCEAVNSCLALQASATMFFVFPGGRDYVLLFDDLRAQPLAPQARPWAGPAVGWGPLFVFSFYSFLFSFASIRNRIFKKWSLMQNKCSWIHKNVHNIQKNNFSVFWLNIL